MVYYTLFIYYWICHKAVRRLFFIDVELYTIRLFNLYNER